jgi:hypothetical protein
MEESFRRIWEEISVGIRPHVSVDAYQRWFAAIDLVSADESALVFQVPNTISIWLRLRLFQYSEVPGKLSFVFRR